MLYSVWIDHPVQVSWLVVLCLPDALTNNNYSIKGFKTILTILKFSPPYRIRSCNGVDTEQSGKNAAIMSAGMIRVLVASVNFLTMHIVKGNFYPKQYSQVEN
jgi:hypothetical protein